MNSRDNIISLHNQRAVSTLIMALKKIPGLLVLIISGTVLSQSPAMSSVTTKNNVNMPIEYHKVKELVNKIQAHNNLGNYPLTFTIVNGDYGGWRAEQLRLCKEDKCFFYDDLNPFGYNSKIERELIRQSYLFGDIAATAYTNGTIKLSQSTFRILQGRDDFLSCLIAHEISHVINHDIFEESKASVEGGFDSDSEEDQLKRTKLGQEYELKADKNMINMIANTGIHQIPVCYF